MVIDERSAKLEELRKIKEEIDTLLVEKAQIVNDINVPVLKAKAEADKIIKDAKDEADITLSASNKILKEAQDTHIEAEDMIKTAKGVIEEAKNKQAQLEQDKTDFNGIKFAHENTVKQSRNNLYSKEQQINSDNESLNQRLIEVKQREDSMARREISVKTAENSLGEQKDILDVRKSSLDAISAKLELSKKDMADRETAIYAKEILKIKLETEATQRSNQAILDEIKAKQVDLTRQQNDLARQIEILDNLKNENDEQLKSLKEQQRLIEMKQRQNQEKIDKLNELRKEEK